jgi:hypothetical protein
MISKFQSLLTSFSDGFLVTPDISLRVLGNVLQAVFKGIQNSDGADSVSPECRYPCRRTPSPEEVRVIRSLRTL